MDKYLLFMPILTAVGILIALLLGWTFLFLVPSQYILAYWLLIGIGMIPASFLWMTPPIWYELEHSEFNFRCIVVTAGLATAIVFAVESIIITFLYGDLIWGFIGLAIFAAGTVLYLKRQLFYKDPDIEQLILTPCCALGIIFGILSGGGLACVFPILFLAVFCAILLLKWDIFYRPHKGPYDDWTDEDYKRIRKQTERIREQKEEKEN